MPQRPDRDDEPPPLVAYWRDVLRRSRIGRWMAKHKNASAAIAAAIAVLKLWKWFIFDLIRAITHPGASFQWAVSHALLAVALTAAVFGIAFAVARFGIDWFTPEDENPPPRNDGWSGRPPNRHATTHPPRLG